MPGMIVITAGTVQVKAELNRTQTARALEGTLPIKAKVSTWGDEIYFDVPLHIEIEDGKQVVEAGDVAYWPDGPSLCLFFGRTPASRGDEIRAASPVTVVGKILGDPKGLKAVKPGAVVTVEKAALS
ncbi:MAG: cyclophilin-like fold protein [Dehalococcoidia bacterium]|nr:cyclophilin-like fold protein [Dehalococcoidia bacterium]